MWNIPVIRMGMGERSVLNWDVYILGLTQNFQRTGDSHF